MVIVEAFRPALPVIASRLGSMAEIVDDGVTELHFASSDKNDLASKVRWAAAHAEETCEMGENARREYEMKYTPYTNYNLLSAIYEDVVRQRPRRQGYRSISALV